MIQNTGNIKLKKLCNSICFIVVMNVKMMENLGEIKKELTDQNIEVYDFRIGDEDDISSYQYLIII